MPTYDLTELAVLKCTLQSMCIYTPGQALKDRARLLSFYYTSNTAREFLLYCTNCTTSFKKWILNLITSKSRTKKCQTLFIMLKWLYSFKFQYTHTNQFLTSQLWKRQKMDFKAKVHEPLSHMEHLSFYNVPSLQNIGRKRALLTLASICSPESHHIKIHHF